MKSHVGLITEYDGISYRCASVCIGLSIGPIMLRKWDLGYEDLELCMFRWLESKVCLVTIITSLTSLYNQRFILLDQIQRNITTTFLPYVNNNGKKRVVTFVVYIICKSIVSSNLEESRGFRSQASDIWRTLYRSFVSYLMLCFTFSAWKRREQRIEPEPITNFLVDVIIVIIIVRVCSKGLMGVKLLSIP